MKNVNDRREKLGLADLLDPKIYRKYRCFGPEGNMGKGKSEASYQIGHVKLGYERGGRKIGN